MEDIPDDAAEIALEFDLVWIKVAERTFILLTMIVPFHFYPYPLIVVQAPQPAGRSD